MPSLKLTLTRTRTQTLPLPSTQTLTLPSTHTPTPTPNQVIVEHDLARAAEMKPRRPRGSSGDLRGRPPPKKKERVTAPIPNPIPHPNAIPIPNPIPNPIPIPHPNPSPNTSPNPVRKGARRPLGEQELRRGRVDEVMGRSWFR